MEIKTSFEEHLMNKIRPHIMKVLNELNVGYAEYNNDEVVIQYAGKMYHIKIKEKNGKGKIIIG